MCQLKGNKWQLRANTYLSHFILLVYIAIYYALSIMLPPFMRFNKKKNSSVQLLVFRFPFVLVRNIFSKSASQI